MEGSLSEVGNSPPHNSNTLHGPVARNTSTHTHTHIHTHTHTHTHTQTNNQYIILLFAL